MFPRKFVSLNNGLCRFIRKILVYNNCSLAEQGGKVAQPCQKHKQIEKEEMSQVP